MTQCVVNHFDRKENFEYIFRNMRTEVRKTSVFFVLAYIYVYIDHIVFIFMMILKLFLSVFWSLFLNGFSRNEVREYLDGVSQRKILLLCCIILSSDT